jgi:hypothetical protein
VLLKVPSQAQNDAPLIKKANNAFQSGDFNSALNEYRQLLSKDPKNIDFNYKYATCLYNTSEINKAAKFYDLILNMYEPPVDSYFFRGKIYQHNYDFQNAIKSFEKYKSLLGKKDLDLGADKEIKYCVNAQNQLKNIGSVKTLNRYSANRRDFYQTYKLSNTAISFIPIDELFSKQNSKKNFKPLIASFRGMKYRFFASYGLEARTGKDIYVQMKNEKNEWDEPIRLGSEVNSLGDEDFPFFDEQNGILYFSSDGHNSIGGFDLFKVNFNLSESSASDRKNLNFPFCSPNDDLFLVPDLPSKNAYFASNRNGELNKVEVFLIELSDSIIPMITIPGKLADQVDPMNKNVQIDLISAFSNERFGPYYSDSEGNYLLAIPKAGVYTFKVKVSGSLIEFEKQVEIPTTNDANKIEQKIIYSMKGTKENVEIITRLVDQDNLTPQLSLRKLKETANFQVNSGSLITNIQPLNKNTLKDLGYSDSDSSKAIEQLMDDLLDVELDIEKNLKFQEELVQQLEQNENEISTLKAKKESLNNEFTKAKNSSEKNKINSEIRTIDWNIQKIKKQNLVLSHEIDAIVENKWISRDNYTEIKKISTQINDQLLNSNDKSIESIVSENKEKIKHLLDGNLGDKEKLVQQKENSLLQQEKGVAEKIANYNAQIANLNSEIKVQEQILKTDKNKKQQELVQSKIKELTQNRNLTEELLNEANYQLKIIKLTQSAIAENKELIQKIDARAEQKSTFSTNKPIQNFEIDALSLADEILEQELGMIDSIENNYQNDIVALEKIEDEKERYSSLKVREEKYQSELKQKIRDNLSDSEKDKLFERIQLSENRLNEINENFNKLVSNEVSKSANPVSSDKSVVNENETQSENNSSQNEIVKSANPVSSDKSVVNENETQTENNSSQNEIAKSANPVSSDKSVVNENETKTENNSSQNEIAKSVNPVSSDKSVVNENETQSENNPSQNEIAKSANPVSSDKSVVNENETQTENNSSQNEIVKSANPVSSDKSAVNENETQSENNSSQNEITKSANPVSSDKSVVNENETKSENNSSQNEIVKTANPVSSDKSVVNENETKSENKSSQNEIAKTANPVSSDKSVVNENETKTENKSSQNEIAKSANPVSSDKSVVNENVMQPENNSSQNEIVKSANPVSSDKSAVNENETKSENNSSQNEIAKSANPVSSDKSVVNENETQSENNSSQNDIVKSANPVSSDKSVVNENETQTENKSSQNEIAKSANPISSDKSVVNENETQSENKSSQNEIAKSANPVSSDKSVVNGNETQSENKSSQNEIVKSANPVSSDKSVVNENVTQPENNSSQNEIAKKQDSNVYKDLDSIRKKEIDAFKSYAENGSRLISIKKDELKNVKNENEKNKLIQEIAELENNNRIEYKQARRVEKTAILNQQFPELEIFTTNDLVGQATEIKLRELELDKKISSTINRLEKDQLMKQKDELVSLRSVLEKNIEESKELTYFTPSLPEISEPLSDVESASLRLSEDYQNYIIERINFNNLIEKLEKAQNNNRFLRELIQIKLSDSTDVQLNQSIMNLANQLKSNEEFLDNIEKEIENKLVTINSFESANSFEWLLKNNIQPAKRIERESNLTDIASNFSIGKNPKISIEKPLPINVNNPTGLIYRVQVGAFRKPISKDAFRDFAPVSGEVLKNGLTCYLAGYFNSSKSAISARKQIRSLGYVDAFIVAYCDGKRISFAQGRELEISGRCKSMSQDELILALKQNNSSNEINSDRKINEYKSANYLNTPNARKAEIGEEQEHLFFTVQIGVYNKPISNNQLAEFSKLVTFKTDKGKIRYSSGMFENLNDAKIHRKEALARGIKDAFIVAYYKGKRISIVEANNLISKNDPSIFQKVNKSISVNTNNSNSSKDSLVNLMFYLPEVKPSIKNDSIVQFSIECTKDEAISKLERLNRVGIFTYQPEKGKIVSSKMNWTNMSTIQREYLQDFKSENSNNPSLSIQLDITNKLWNGAFCDWLLRSNLSYYFESKDELKILNLYLENESERELVLKKANELLISVMN